MRCMYFAWEPCMSPSFLHLYYWEYIRMTFSKIINVLPFSFVISNFSLVYFSTVNPTSFPIESLNTLWPLVPEWQKQGNNPGKSLCIHALRVRLTLHCYSHFSPNYMSHGLNPKELPGKRSTHQWQFVKHSLVPAY